MSEDRDSEETRLNASMGEALDRKNLNGVPMADVLKMLQQPASLGQVINLNMRALDAMLLSYEYGIARAEGTAPPEKEDLKSIRKYMIEVFGLLKDGIEALPDENGTSGGINQPIGESTDEH